MLVWYPTYFAGLQFFYIILLIYFDMRAWIMGTHQMYNFRFHWKKYFRTSIVAQTLEFIKQIIWQIMLNILNMKSKVSVLVKLVLMNHTYDYFSFTSCWFLCEHFFWTNTIMHFILEKRDWGWIIGEPHCFQKRESLKT